MSMPIDPADRQQLLDLFVDESAAGLWAAVAVMVVARAVLPDGYVAVSKDDLFSVLLTVPIRLRDEAHTRLARRVLGMEAV